MALGGLLGFCDPLPCVEQRGAGAGGPVDRRRDTAGAAGEGGVL